MESLEDGILAELKSHLSIREAKANHIETLKHEWTMKRLESSMFDLERAIRSWKKEYLKRGTFEDGTLAELESHLREETGRRKEGGLGDKDAFDKAVALIGRPEAIGGEFWKTNARAMAVNPDPKASKFATGLLWNYFKIARRKILRLGGSSLINIAGLAVAAAFFILVLAYVRDERTFDRFHSKSDRIFQLTSSMDKRPLSGHSSPPLGAAMAAEFPEIVRSVRYWEQGTSVARGGRIFQQSVGYADHDFFVLFDFPLVRGDAASCLSSPNQAVVTHESARKYFGDQDPIGQALTIDVNGVKTDFLVSGVAADLPDNSSIRFGVLLPFAGVSRVFAMDFEDSLVTAPFFHTTFFELRDGRKAAELESKFPAFIKRHYGTDLAKFMVAPEFFRFGLQKFADYHWGELNGSPALRPRGRAANSANLAALALMALLLACFNYANLAVAQSTVRFKEIGIRKTLGAGRSQVVRQFLAESVLLSVAALVAGLGLAHLFLNAFNSLTGKRLSLAFLLQGWNLLILAVLAAIIGIAAGFYPALVLSRPQPVDVFRDKVRLGGKALVRRILIALQFAVSVFLIIGTLVRLEQMRLFTKAALGYDPRNVVMIPTYSFWFGADQGDRTLAFFKNETRNRAEILGLTGVSGRLNDGWRSTGEIPLQAADGQVRSALFRVDPGFVRMMGLRIVQGRDFLPTAGADSDEVLVNEAFVRRFGLRDPVGRRFFDFARDPHPVQRPDPFNPVIAGVVKDYHFAPLQNAIEPLVLCLKRTEERIGFIAARIRPEARTAAPVLLQEIWKKIQPDKPFDFQYLEDILGVPYAGERNWGRIFAASSFFAVFIACLGLFGLTSLLVTRRTKEIGIRKVLGASSQSIVALVNRSFVGPLLIANVLAWPAAYFAANRWLRDFAVRISPGAHLFLIGGAAAVAVAILTISARSARAAAADPARSLRTE